MRPKIDVATLWHVSRECRNRLSESSSQSGYLSALMRCNLAVLTVEPDISAVGHPAIQVFISPSGGVQDLFCLIATSALFFVPIASAWRRSNRFSAALFPFSSLFQAFFPFSLLFSVILSPT